MRNINAVLAAATLLAAQSEIQSHQLSNPTRHVDFGANKNQQMLNRKKRNRRRNKTARASRMRNQ